jgi:hypothetical protein
MILKNRRLTLAANAEHCGLEVEGILGIDPFAEYVQCPSHDAVARLLWEVDKQFGGV